MPETALLPYLEQGVPCLVRRAPITSPFGGPPPSSVSFPPWTQGQGLGSPHDPEPSNPTPGPEGTRAAGLGVWQGGQAQG